MIGLSIAILGLFSFAILPPTPSTRIAQANPRTADQEHQPGE